MEKEKLEVRSKENEIKKRLNEMREQKNEEEWKGLSKLWNHAFPECPEKNFSNIRKAMDFPFLVEPHFNVYGEDFSLIPFPPKVFGQRKIIGEERKWSNTMYSLYLKDYQFSGASLTGTTWKSVSFSYCSFVECVLEGVNFLNCKFQNCVGLPLNGGHRFFDCLFQA